MRRKIVLLILGILIIGAVSLLFIRNRTLHESTPKILTDKKVLVVYFSAQNHTKEVAKKIANNIGADIFEIEPVDKYTDDDLDWTVIDSRVSRENEDANLRNIELVKTKVDNWDSYDVILFGYPIWWGEAAWPVNNFITSNDFTGKTVIPFCTSVSSSIENSVKKLKEMAKGGDWREGKRFDSNAKDEEIKMWTDTLK